MNKGTATIMKLFIELNMDWEIRVRGISENRARVRTLENPSDTATGMPRNMSMKNSDIRKMLIGLPPFLVL
jgi:hypothetical protein